jgi:hypothetical protein
MSNTPGLLLIGLGIVAPVALVVVVDCVARMCSETRAGRICKLIDHFIRRVSGDDWGALLVAARRSRASSFGLG